MTGKRNLAHRMGRWSGTHPWTAILGWLAFVLISFLAIPSFVTTNTLKDSELGVGESGRAAKVARPGVPDESDPRDRDDPRADRRAAASPTADLERGGP